MIMTYIIGAILAVLFLIWAVIFRNASLADTANQQLKSSKPEYTIQHGPVKANLIPHSIWECHLDGRVFRAYSCIGPHRNKWTMKDGTAATEEEKQLFVDTI
ncbi:hypothetical protein LCGC14_0478440 [marine sediment metagenome]|uniref:Uncharacterized protein n=1 Tax=marine sediment metagenome TaxID=412755 RepID=A0A0F9S9X1_9ZZZZ